MPWIGWQPLIPVLCGDSQTPGDTRPSVSWPKPYRDSHVQAIGRRAERGRRRGLTAANIGIRGRDRLRPPPPTGTTAIRGKHSTVPCVFTPGLHGLPALSRVLDLPCVTGRRGMSAFSRDFIFGLGGPTRPAPRYAYGGLSCLLAVASKLSSVCLALTPSRRHRGVDRQKVADIAAWGRTAGPCLGAD